MKPTCPKCGTEEIQAVPACHTYLTDKGWYSCMGCYSAIRYECNNCDWEFTHGLNPKNPRAKVNSENEPSWHEDSWFMGDPGKHKDVKWFDEYDPFGDDDAGRT